MIESAIRKVVRVEEVPLKPILEARIELIAAKKAVDEGVEGAIPKALEKNREYIRARTPPRQRMVIFDTFEVKLR